MICSLIFINSVSDFGLAITDFVGSSSDGETYVIRDLFSNTSYWVSVGSSYFPNEDDIGFKIYSTDKFKEADVLFTADNPGPGDEELLIAPSYDGDYYLKVWMNGGDFGFVEILVWENGTSNYAVVEEFTPSILSSMRWLWIFLGVCGGIMILTIGFAIFIGRKAIRQHQTRVAEAIEKGYGLPRYGRKKDKCPFCNVKLPPEYQPKCPYCGAPITEEE